MQQPTPSQPNLPQAPAHRLRTPDEFRQFIKEMDIVIAEQRAESERLYREIEQLKREFIRVKEHS